MLRHAVLGVGAIQSRMWLPSLSAAGDDAFTAPVFGVRDGRGTHRSNDCSGEEAAAAAECVTVATTPLTISLRKPVNLCHRRCAATTGARHVGVPAVNVPGFRPSRSHEMKRVSAAVGRARWSSGASAAHSQDSLSMSDAERWHAFELLCNLFVSL
ncbi:hypothetical protein FN846DRAFT_280210 [Sphaerosporella brunnea]|uniref:Uncharacterized protein n=1 Tax=Sphaerosporella brunnea TaxID=1250544 RepID=A0A5J5F796_9PEZI|nr:hypothetical protein FN846DRAFT_280210 [Sphaerosporella brunnea]